MKNIETYATDQTKEDIKNLEKDFQYVYDAQDALLKKLFGFVPEHPCDYAIGRKTYIKAILEVQQEFELEEGNPMLVLFVLEQLSRSPKITDSSKATKNRKDKLEG